MLHDYIITPPGVRHGSVLFFWVGCSKLAYVLLKPRTQALTWHQTERDHSKRS